MQIDLAAEIPIQFYPPTKNKNMSSCDYFYDFEVLNIYSNDFAINIKLYELLKIYPIFLHKHINKLSFEFVEPLFADKLFLLFF
jgi:hypothetical protein